ncbi:unnamed protein product [Fraxinus pennsylvanica]|uniref:Pentatricopeptide repeat-containing protein n=1 Tax=Fraxinus pennsylvanica TaxID=56036 RepID=A0AAD2DTX5_9LAMI|nr:unnamed protein product [Fraxinus pennsylvanica]
MKRNELPSFPLVFPSLFSVYIYMKTENRKPDSLSIRTHKYFPSLRGVRRVHRLPLSSPLKVHSVDTIISVRSIAEPDIQLWTLLITAYTKQGHPKEAIKLYAEFKNSGKVNPDEVALLSVAKACAKSGDVLKAKDIHEDAIKYGFGSDLLLGNAMIDMYGKCNYIEGAKIVFDDLRVKDVISWTSLCSCYVNCGLPGDALWAIRAMCLSGTMPNAMTLSSILPACSVLKCLNLGREVHGFVAGDGHTLKGSSSLNEDLSL